MPAALRPEVRPGSFDATGLVPLGVLLNLGILLAPAWLIGGGRIGSGAEVGFFLLGASALCLADLAGPRHRTAAVSVAGLEHGVLCLAWAQGLALLAVFWAGLVERLPGHGHALPTSVKAVGFVLMLAGALLRHAAIRTLGARFVTEVLAGPELVRRGVYGRIRHPSETGLLMAAMGSGLLLSSLAGVAVVVVVLLPVVVLRTRIEDEALALAFGLDHDRYVREAGRFLPPFRSR